MGDVIGKGFGCGSDALTMCLSPFWIKRTATGSVPEPLGWERGTEYVLTVLLLVA